jgi:hypothetical protein
MNDKNDAGGVGVGVVVVGCGEGQAQEQEQESAARGGAGRAGGGSPLASGRRWRPWCMAYTWPGVGVDSLYLMPVQQACLPPNSVSSLSS